MKKLLTVMAAALLIFGAAGQASAYFDMIPAPDFSSLAISVFNQPSNQEWGYDLGRIGVDFDLNDSNLTLAPVGTLTAAELFAGSFAGMKAGVYTATNSGTGPANIVVGLNKTTAPTLSGAQMTNYKNSVQGIFNFGYGHGSKEKQIGAGGTSDFQSKLMTNYGGFISGIAPGEMPTLDPLTVPGGYMDIYLYQYENTSLIAGYQYDYAGILRVKADGSIVFNPNGGHIPQVPVPAAVRPPGSGLVGLVGIRRRNA